MPRIYIRCYTRSEVENEPLVFMGLLNQVLPKSVPQSYYLREKNKFDIQQSGLSEFAGLWRSNIVFWSKRKPHVYGFASIGNKSLHTGILHTFDVALATDDEVLLLVAKLAIELQAEYAFAHPFPNQLKGLVLEDERLGSSTARTLLLGLPGVPWVACYGPAYVEHFGAAVMAKLPGTVERLSATGAVVNRIVESSAVALKHEAEFLRRQSVLREMLTNDAFYDPSQPSKRSNGPQFLMPIVEPKNVDKSAS